MTQRGVIVRGFAFVACAMLATLIWVTVAVAVTVITACPTTLNKFGETYRLNADLGSVGTCLTVANDRITIDFNGHIIRGDGTGVGVVNDVARDRITLKNGEVQNFATGVDLGLSSRVEVRDTEVTENTGKGIIVGAHGLVVGTQSGKETGGPAGECTVDDNGGTGITMGDFGQVQGCKVGESEDTACEDHDWNDGFGIVGGAHMLITNNIVSCNTSGGIHVGDFSTVTNNTTTSNTGDGIFAGKKSVVSGNIADNNTADGIEVLCPSTVTNNEASANGGANFNLIGAGCFSKGNTSQPTTN